MGHHRSSAVRMMSCDPPWHSNLPAVWRHSLALTPGTRWPDLPDRYPSPSTCGPRWHRWEEDGTWLRV